MAKKFRRLSLSEGAIVTALGLLSGLVSWWLALGSTQVSTVIVLTLYTWFALWFFSHTLTHHIVGRLVGIRFQYYFVGRSAIRKLKLPVISRVMEHVPVLVLKTEGKSLAVATPRARRWMYASGALVSMALPWLVVPSAIVKGPTWAGVFFLLLVLGNDVFTLYFSPKTGDLHRARASNV